MATQITISLPDDLYQGVSSFAQLLGKDVRDVLTETIALSLSPIATQTKVRIPVTTLSDRDLLALAEVQMQPQDDPRLGELLERQEGGLLTIPEQSELLGLMQGYQEEWLRKTQALCEAVKRGLCEPLSA
jgi:hypothetical protein